jgi:glucose/arabinose dehydrogenase
MPSFRARTVVVTVLLIAATLVAVPASAQVAAQCFGEDATIEAAVGVPTVGTDGDDVIVGTTGPDEIDGGGGDDLICGLSMGDTIGGGPGNDRIDGGGGRDDISGGAGKDEILGGRGADSIRGGKGNDTINGGAHRDEIAGKSGNDTINGGRGNDTVNGGRGRDTINGNGGHDNLNGGRGLDTIDGGRGRDVCLSGAGGADDTRCLEGLELSLVADLGDRAGLVLAAPGDNERLFVVEQYHGVRVIVDGKLKNRRFIDLEGQVTTGNEQGVLGLAFHPGYAENGRVFVSYTTPGRDNLIVEYTVDPENPNRVDADSRRVIIRVDQPHRWHNGGHIAFGPDGYLYIGIGDGGPGHDPNATGQDTSNLLSGISRIDIDVDTGAYAIPQDNPFVDADGRDELWAYGLRNPWRFSFDEPTGRMYIGDVGQFIYEEINVAPIGEGGINYGWSVAEGPTCLGGGTRCDTTGFHEPMLALPHFTGTCSVIGGSVYRGETIPELVGHYTYSDFCTRELSSFKVRGNRATDQTTWLAAPAQAAIGITPAHEPPPGGVPSGSVTSWGVDNDGELYIATIGGAVYKVEPVR